MRRSSAAPPAPRRQDKGDSSGTIRRHAQRHGPFDRAAYFTRNLVERLIGRCTQFRRLATRDEQRAEHFGAMWTWPRDQMRRYE